MTADKVLIVDDEEYVRDSIAEIARGAGLEVVLASSCSQALEVLEAGPVQTVLTDLRMPDGDGIALLEALKRRGSAAPVIVITGHGTVGDAVVAMKAGAYDFIQKPIDPEQLVLVLRRALEHRSLLGEVSTLREAVQDLQGFQELVGSSLAMTRVRELIAQVGPSEAIVLVTGESGTGKELVAAEIHRHSRRAGQRMVRVNCAAVPDTLFESEFFGHRRGAFSGAISERLGRFAEAEGGTLVLDEIGVLHADMQAKLLRVLESGEYQVVGDSRTRVADARVIAVTNEDLARLVQRGGFRADLYYRLNIFPVEIPPLRQHKEDIREIAEHLLARIRQGAGTRAGQHGLSREVVEVLVSYDWPGNVRELRNVLERAVILAGTRALDVALFRAILESALPDTGTIPPTGFNLRSRLDALERELLAGALARTGGRKKEAALLLGIDPKNLGYYLRKHEVTEGAEARESGPR
jgi:DNA-binding NtrC family response regulator